MPVQRCTLPEGGDGWKWGDSGTCYPTRAQAEKQEEAAYANGYTGDSIALAMSGALDEFNEADHPRAPDGKFGNGNGSSVPVKQKAKLTEQQKIELKDYKEGGYKSLNEYLRKPKEKQTSKDYNGIVKRLDSAVSKSSLSKDTVLYRGVAHSGLAKNAEQFVGKEFNQSAFQSTTTNEKTARQFSGMGGDNGVVFQINAKAGQPAVNTEEFATGNNAEDEILLPRNVTFKATKLEQRGIVKVLHLEIVSNGMAKDSREILALDLQSARTKDANGHLHVADVPISKAEVNEYLGSEIPNYKELGLDPNRKYKLLRDPKELEKAAETFNGKPVLDRHRPQFASDMDRKRNVGSVHGAYFDDPYLKAKDFHVWDGDAISDIESEESSDISCGYLYKPDMTPGVYKGENYDGVMRSIHANHVALVPDGRVSGCVVLDSALPVALPAALPIALPTTLPAILPANKKDILMPASRKAAIVRGALTAYLLPKLAQDQKIDLKPVLLGTTAANWKTAKPQIITRLKTAAAGKLAQDASLEDLAKLLDHFDMPEAAAEDEEVDGMDAEEETEEERKKREKAEAMKKAAEDEAETPEEKEARMKARQEAKDKAAKDAANGNEEFRPGKETAERSAKDGKTGKDKEGPEMQPPGISKGAMDAAIASATTAAIKAERQRQHDIREAENFVRPYIGDLALAQDSAEDVYRLALDSLPKPPNLKGVHPSAFRALLEAYPRPGQRQNNAPALAHDAAAAKSFADRFPNAARIRSI